ncbi:MAG: hypothetical protein AAGA75_21920 [Cyanobacteria bacterium P01_E01_bin.6]
MPVTFFRSTLAKFVAGAAVAGIIGNSAHYIFVKVSSPWAEWSIILSISIWHISLLILLTCILLVYFSYLTQEAWALKNSRKVLEELNQLDDSFLRLIPSLVAYKGSKHDTDSSLKRIIDFYLVNIIKLFDDKWPNDYQLDNCYIVIYRPKFDDPNLLVYWNGFNEPACEREVAFSLGPIQHNEKRGVPAAAFLDERLDCFLTAHVRKNGTGSWESDNLDYKPRQDDDTLRPPFRSLAVACITDNSKNKIGVLCFGSNDSEAFPSEDTTMDLLSVFTRRISVAMEIAERVKH